VQYNEYYPLGLQASTSWTRENSSNNFLYNEGSELNQTTGWYETAFRNYDAALGRLTSIDPMASKYASFSGYHYAYNNPVMSNDPSGADAESDAQIQAQTQFNYMMQMEKLQRELEDKQWADFLASNPGYDGPRDLGLVAQYYGMQAEAAQQKEAALLAAARSGDINAVRQYAAMHGGLTVYKGNAAQAMFTLLSAMEAAKVGRRVPGAPTPSGGVQQVGPKITIIEFGPDHTDTDNLSIKIKLGFNDPDKQFSEYGWIQTVRTNSNQNFPGKPLRDNEPFNDTPGDNTPYYPIAEYNTGGFNTIMADYTGRGKNSTYVIWRAEVTIGGIRDGVFVPLGTMTYGYDIFDGKLDIIYPRVTQPTPWHIDSFTNKSKW